MCYATELGGTALVATASSFSTALRSLSFSVTSSPSILNESFRKVQLLKRLIFLSYCCSLPGGILGLVPWACWDDDWCFKAIPNFIWCVRYSTYFMLLEVYISCKTCNLQLFGFWLLIRRFLTKLCVRTFESPDNFWCFKEGEVFSMRQSKETVRPMLMPRRAMPEMS